MTIVTPKFGMGASVLRVEDQAFITGQGRYTDDIAPDGLLHGFVLRSPVAKGSFTHRLDRSGKASAGRAPGADRRRSCASRRPAFRRHAEAARRHPRADPRHPDPVPRPRRPCRRRRRLHRRRHPRAGAGRRRADRGRLRFRRMRRPLPRPRSTKARRWCGPSSARTAPSSTSSATRSKTEAAFAKAAKVVGIKFLNNRLVCNYMEPRAAIGEWKPDEDRFVLIAGSQGVHGMRDIIAGKVFKIPPEKLRVITPDVGGGFGPKVLRLSRISAGAGGRQAPRPAGQMGLRPHRAFPRRRARPRQLCRGRDGARRRRPLPRAAESISPPISAPISRSTVRSSPISASPCRPASTTSRHSRSRSTASTPTPARSMPIAARGGPRPRCCWRSWSTNAPAQLGMGRDEIRRPQLHQAGAVSLSHGDRPALRRRRVRRPHDAGHGAGRLVELRRAAEAVEGRRQDPRHRHGDLYRGLRLPRLRAGLPAG